MSIQDKAAETVEKLLRMTVKGKLRWERSTEKDWLTQGTDDLVEVDYTADVAGNHFVIYEERYRTHDADDNAYWTSNLILKILDEKGVPLWKFPSNVSGLHDLFKSVQPQAGDVSVGSTKY